MDPQTKHPNTLTAAKASGEKQPPPPFETAYATPASLETAQKDKETGVNLPQPGHCTYLMIDQTFLQTSNSKDPNLQKLIDEIELVGNSDYVHITAYSGYIVMIGTSERSGSSLTAMAQRFYRTIPKACIYIGTGDVTHTDNKFSITGFPTDKTQNEWKDIQPGVYLTNEFHKLMTDPTKRDAALGSIEARPHKPTALHRLIDFRPKASAKIGGPDRLIGKEKELLEIEDILTDRKQINHSKRSSGYRKIQAYRRSVKTSAGSNLLLGRPIQQRLKRSGLD